MKRKKFSLVIIALSIVSYLIGADIYLPPSNISLPFFQISEKDSRYQAVLYREVNTEVLPSILKQTPGYYLIPSNVAAKLFNSGLGPRLIASFATDMLYFITDDVDIKTLADFDGKEFLVGGQGSTPDIIV
ncbi:MAG: hypothetical protein JXR56_00180, partial [Candidatus Cloacimonetes bacterium]|nr:hypothetical protein [Candidatus Cloacimonadota bacterium]